MYFSYTQQTRKLNRENEDIKVLGSATGPNFMKRLGAHLQHHDGAGPNLIKLLGTYLGA